MPFAGMGILLNSKVFNQRGTVYIFLLRAFLLTDIDRHNLSHLIFLLHPLILSSETVRCLLYCIYHIT